MTARKDPIRMTPHEMQELVERLWCALHKPELDMARVVRDVWPREGERG